MKIFTEISSKFHSIFRISGFWLIFISPTTLFGQQDNPPLSESMGAAFLKALLALFFVLALIFVLVYLLKRYLPNLVAKTSSVSHTGDKNIEVIAIKSLAPRKSLYLVRIGEREILIGSHEQGLSALGQWENGGRTNVQGSDL